jgi:hypothetical protein
MFRVVRVNAMAGKGIEEAATGLGEPGHEHAHAH